MKSSAIEGENLNPEEVRSSIARRLGIEIAGLVPASRNVEGIVEMMLDATQQFAKPLTKDRLFNWHAALFPTGRSGIEKEMQVFLSWFNNVHDIDLILKAGISHLWFVTIHPFEDGNGRIARAIGDMVLARADETPDRFYSLSSQIDAEREDYYNHLEKQQRGTPEITEWLEWFLDCLGRAISGAETILAQVLFKAKFWNKVNQKPVNERQRLIINLMLADNFKGHMNTSKYARIAKCSNDTALRDIQDLKERGIFIQNTAGGRSTSYRLTDSIKKIDSPHLE